MSKRAFGIGSLSCCCGINDIDTMLPYRRYVTSNRTERFGTCACAESTGNFLFDLYHSDIPFGQVVIKGNAEVIHKSQDLAFVVT